MLAYIDRWAADLEQSQHLNFLRWPILNQRVHLNPRALGSFLAEVDVVKDFMKGRIAWMDKKLGYTYKPSGINELHVDMAQPYQVYSLSGQPYGNSVENLPSGIYVVRQGTATRKIVVK